MNFFANAVRANIWIRATTAVLIAAAITLSADAQAAPAQENDESKLQELKTRVHFAWQMQEFAKLDAWAKEYGTSTIRTPSGFTYLPSFYMGFHEAFNGGDAEIAAKMWAATLEAWTTSAPQSATPHIANVEILLARAESARGTGYANTVFQENWDKFGALLREARNYLSANRQVAEQDPHFWPLMARAR